MRGVHMRGKGNGTERRQPGQDGGKSEGSRYQTLLSRVRVGFVSTDPGGSLEFRL